MTIALTALNLTYVGIWLGFGMFFGVSIAFGLSAFVGVIITGVIAGWKDARDIRRARPNTQTEQERP